jgi:aspartyl protease family protein
VSEGDSISLVWSVGALVLVVSALVARRLPSGTLVRTGLAWVAIFGVAWAIFANRDSIAPAITAAGERIGIGAQTVTGDTVRIDMDTDGHFWARVSMNGVERRMLVDSGATITALSTDSARRVGVAGDADLFPVVINTANGRVEARRATVEQVRLGSLEMRDLRVVISPAFGETDVIGMNFLSRLGSWRVEGRTLILEPVRQN